MADKGGHPAPVGGTPTRSPPPIASTNSPSAASGSPPRATSNTASPLGASGGSPPPAPTGQVSLQNSQSYTCRQRKESELPKGVLTKPSLQIAEPAYDGDSAVADDDYGNSTASLSSSVLHYRTIHGRTYHSDRGNAQYWASNDDKQNDSLDIQSAGHFHHFPLSLSVLRLYCLTCPFPATISSLWR